jgi:hypothetical protein
MAAELTAPAGKIRPIWQFCARRVRFRPRRLYAKSGPARWFLICSGTPAANKRRQLMKFTSARLTLAAALASAVLSACVVAPAPGYYGGAVVAAAPPPLQYEAVGVAPFPGAFWIGGGWFWEGGRYAWHPGYWEHPRAGYRWVPHRWVRGGGGWREAPGHWERR